jgi:PAS domain S-box-containing protein
LTDHKNLSGDERPALADHRGSLQTESSRRIRVEETLSELIAGQGERGAEGDTLFRLLVESVRDYAIFLLDPKGNVATWNAGAERFKGYTAGEIIGRHFSAFYPVDDVRAGKCEYELEVAAREGRFEEEGWRVRKDGSRFWANVVITAVRDRDARLVGYAKVTRDLTDRKHAEDSRLVAEERFRLLVESVKDHALFMLDPHGNITTWNAGAERIKGYTADEIIGSHFSRFYPEDAIKAGNCERGLEIAAREGRFADEGWRIRKDGSRFWASVVIGAMRDKHAKLIGFSKVTRDLTEQKRNEEERAARLAAEQANKTKDEFLAILGHELRNPLAPIVTALQLIKLRDGSHLANEHQVIERQVTHMVRLVDDLLDVSRIARGKIDLDPKHLDVRDAIANAVEIAGPLFEQRRQHFEVSASPWPIIVHGDASRLTQVFTNLLTNAARYTQSNGHITLAVRRTGNQAVIEVRDNGMGIEKALLPRLFDLFVQGYQSSERASGGLGLGLTLVRSLVKLHGGDVDVHSDGPGLGACFTVRLPALDQASLAEVDDVRSMVPPSAPHRWRILVVDDNEDARALLSDLLGAVGHEVRSASDGFDALAVAESFAPDVAILDLGLPTMDGFELATRLREMMKHALPSLIALSGYGRKSDQERSQAVGFDRHLVKPIDVNVLLDTIAELQRPKSATTQ